MSQDENILMRSSMAPGPKPCNPRLYAQVKAAAKRRFDKWPSAYATGWLVQEYKRRGGRYSGSKRPSGLGRWFRERWVDVCEPGQPPCGRRAVDRRRYPYCRPSVRVNARTPKLASQLTYRERAELCRRKRRRPSARMRSHRPTVAWG